MPGAGLALTIGRVMEQCVDGLALVGPLARAVVAFHNRLVAHCFGAHGRADRAPSAFAFLVAGRPRSGVEIVGIKTSAAGKPPEQESLLAFIGNRDLRRIGQVGIESGEGRRDKAKQCHAAKRKGFEKIREQGLLPHSWDRARNCRAA